MKTYYVAVTFTIDAPDAETAEHEVTEYLELASRYVECPAIMTAVDVDGTEEYIPEGDA